MTKGKNYNSIVFLTTLSVYLGLVLAGGAGAPQVLAQAALTRNFDIQVEAEIKDDLDNKPDDEAGNNVQDDFPFLFARLLTDLKSEVVDGNIALPLETDFFVQAKYAQSQNRSSAGIHSTIPTGALYLSIEHALNGKLREQTGKLAEFVGADKTSAIKIEADANYLSLKISFSKNQADQFAGYLNRKYVSSVSLIQDSLTKQLYENTKAASENNQVFIVTRLPRGSIDSLLAAKNAN